MSVITTADERRRDVRELIEPLLINVKDIIYNLEQMIDPDVWGGNEWALDFENNASKDIKRLNKLIERLREMKKIY